MLKFKVLLASSDKYWHFPFLSQSAILADLTPKIIVHLAIDLFAYRFIKCNGREKNRFMMNVPRFFFVTNFFVRYM